MLKWETERAVIYSQRVSRHLSWDFSPGLLSPCQGSLRPHSAFLFLLGFVLSSSVSGFIPKFASPDTDEIQPGCRRCHQALLTASSGRLAQGQKPGSFSYSGVCVTRGLSFNHLVLRVSKCNRKWDFWPHGAERAAERLGLEEHMKRCQVCGTEALAKD